MVLQSGDFWKLNYLDFITMSMMYRLQMRKQVYRMLENNRVDIAKKEALFGVAFNGTLGTRKINGMTVLQATNVDYDVKQFFKDETVDTLEKNLNPARDQIFQWLKNDYPITFQNFTSAASINSLNILLDPGTDQNAKNSANLNASALYQKKSDGYWIDRNSCILIGEDGEDKLRGGKGNDILLGGIGDDTYYYRIGDGHDWIADQDKTGKVIIENTNGVVKKEIALGNFYKQGESWTDATGSIRITHNSPWKVELSDGGVIELGDDFASGNLRHQFT